jgi:hypothetical protein
MLATTPRDAKRGIDHARVSRHEARRGRFHVLGFAGNAAPDHVDRLYALGDWLRAWKVVR